MLHAGCSQSERLVEADGSRQRVVLHCELVRYLQAKSGGLTDHLKFQGRNVCVFGRVQESTQQKRNSSPHQSSMRIL